MCFLFVEVHGSSSSSTDSLNSSKSIVNQKVAQFQERAQSASSSPHIDGHRRSAPQPPTYCNIGVGSKGGKSTQYKIVLFIKFLMWGCSFCLVFIVYLFLSDYCVVKCFCSHFSTRIRRCKPHLCSLCPLLFYMTVLYK